LLIGMMLAVHRHYVSVAEQLRVDLEEARRRLRLVPRRSVAVVPVASLNRASLTALTYARSIADDVVAVHVATEPESGEALQQRWREAGLTIPLVIVDSPYRELLGPLVAVIEKIHREKGGTADHGRHPGVRHRALVGAPAPHPDSLAPAPGSRPDPRPRDHDGAVPPAGVAAQGRRTSTGTGA